MLQDNAHSLTSRPRTAILAGSVIAALVSVALVVGCRQAPKGDPTLTSDLVAETAALREEISALRDELDTVTTDLRDANRRLERQDDLLRSLAEHTDWKPPDRPRDPGAKAAKPGDDGPWTYPVFYGTNRKPLSAANHSEGFGDDLEPDGVIHRGRCNVRINEGHKFGSIGERNWFTRWIWGDDRVLLTDISGLSRDAFSSEIKAALSKLQPEKADVVVYIHGFDNTFEESSVRAAQIGYDLKIPLMAFFSWPSLGTRSVAAYKADTERISRSTGAIVQFLRDLARDVGNGRVHLIVHSMGNQGLAAAISALDAEANLRFGQIILAAPDLSPARFITVADAYRRLSERTTLYVSRRDLALGASEWLNEEPRIGYPPPIATATGVDTVEVTDFDLTDLGHRYYAEAEPVLYDIEHLLHVGSKPQDRVRVRPITDGPSGAVYWRIGQ